MRLRVQSLPADLPEEYKVSLELHNIGSRSVARSHQSSLWLHWSLFFSIHTRCTNLEVGTRLVSHAGAAAMHRKNVESSFGLHQFACKAIEYIFRLPRVVVIRLGPSRSLKIHKYHCLCRENKVEATAHLVVETEFGPACPFF